MTWLLCLGSGLLGMAGPLVIWRFAPILGLIDSPSARSSHRVPTPRGGGIGILGAAFFSAILLGLRPILWGPAIFVGIVSFWDDYRGLSPVFRLLSELLAVVFILPILVSSGPWDAWLVLSALFCAVFLVGTANFFNFMDGINGMAGISGAVGFGLVAFFAWLRGADHSLILFACSLALACFGFLPFNFPRAKVFLGDVGSVFLGFQFAVLVVDFSHSIWELITLAGFLAPIYFDTLLTLFRRLRNRENLFQPHRQHLYQVLVHSRGWRHWQVSLFYGLMQFAVGSLLLMAWHSGHPQLCGPILVAAASIFVLTSFRIGGMRQRPSWEGTQNQENVE